MRTHADQVPPVSDLWGGRRENAGDVRAVIRSRRAVSFRVVLWLAAGFPRDLGRRNLVRNAQKRPDDFPVEVACIAVSDRQIPEGLLVVLILQQAPDMLAVRTFCLARRIRVGDDIAQNREIVSFLQARMFEAKLRRKLALAIFYGGVGPVQKCGVPGIDAAIDHSEDNACGIDVEDPIGRVGLGRRARFKERLRCGSVQADKENPLRVGRWRRSDRSQEVPCASIHFYEEFNFAPGQISSGLALLDVHIQ